jgi:hypothetical protein
MESIWPYERTKVVTMPGNVTQLATVDLDSMKPWCEEFNLDLKSEKRGHVW